MRLVIALLCAGAAAAVPYDSYNDTGFWVIEGGWATADPDCPCIDPWQGNRSVPTTGSWSVLQRDYGANYCRTWDEPMPYCQIAVPPAYCKGEFCYVDHNNCKNRPNTESGYFPGTNLYYSYATCGYTNDFNPSVKLNAQLKRLTGNQAIRVSFPSDSSSGFTLTTLPSGKRDGSIARFTARLLKDAGIEWREVPISRQANFLESDSRTACVHEVSIGGTDLCIGACSLPPPRRTHTHTHQPAPSLLSPPDRGLLADGGAGPPLQLLVDALPGRKSPGRPLCPCARRCSPPFPPHAQNFYLITSSVEFTDSFIEQLAIPFSPFTVQTWLMSLLALAYVSLGMHICEHNRGFDTGTGRGGSVKIDRSGTEDHTTITSPSPRHRSLSEGGFDDNQEKRKQKHKQKRQSLGRQSRQSFASAASAVTVERKTMKSFGQSIYLTMLGYVSAAPAHNARTGLGRVINIGAGLFVVVSMAMYTSQMTTNLVSRARGGGSVTTINGALEGEGDICLMASVAESLVAKYPALGSQYLSAKDAADALTKMSAGSCAHAVLDEHSWTNAQSGRLTPNLKVGDRNHCDKVKVGDPVYTLGNAMPVRENLQFPFSWKATSMAEAGIYEDEVFSAKRKFLAPTKCNSGESGKQFAGSVGIGQMFGPIVICFLCTTFAITATFLKTAIKELQGKLLPLWYATQDPRCPLVARAIATFALGYAVSEAVE